VSNEMDRLSRTVSW